MSPRPAPLVVLILAAGQGTRMRSDRIKLLHEVAGRPMVDHVATVARALKPASVISVVGFQADRVQAALGHLSDHFVVQREQLGTGHAVLRAAALLRRHRGSTLLLLNGDVPTLRPSTLRSLVRQHRRAKADLSVLTAEVDDPGGYGRIVRDARGRFLRIVEHRDADADERKIREINAGIYVAEPASLLRVLRAVRPENAQGEYYLTDAVHYLADRGRPVRAHKHADAREVLGVNDRAELADASATLYARKARDLQRSGVTLLDASRTWIDPRARIGRDTVLYPDVIVEGACRVGRDCVIRPGSRLVDSIVGDRVEIKDHCVVLDSRIGSDSAVGPFAHLRPDSRLGPDVKVGNFVEVKKAALGRGTKASHLSYIGDAEIGTDCNIGAGTITCNYDGEQKHTTRLGRRVFIGSDTQLVAPVTLGDDVYVGAGSTITKDVPPDHLALSRAKQVHIADWSARRKARQAARNRKKKA